MDFENPRCRGASVKEFETSRFIGKKEKKLFSRECFFGVGWLELAWTLKIQDRSFSDGV
jgi:hypothetical protein